VLEDDEQGRPGLGARSGLVRVAGAQAGVGGGGGGGAEAGPERQRARQRRIRAWSGPGRRPRQVRGAGVSSGRVQGVGTSGAPDGAVSGAPGRGGTERRRRRVRRGGPERRRWRIRGGGATVRCGGAAVRCGSAAQARSDSGGPGMEGWRRWRGRNFGSLTASVRTRAQETEISFQVLVYIGRRFVGAARLPPAPTTVFLGAGGGPARP